MSVIDSLPALWATLSLIFLAMYLHERSDAKRARAELVRAEREYAERVERLLHGAQRDLEDASRRLLEAEEEREREITANRETSEKLRAHAYR